jgi:hypothetical protein
VRLWQKATESVNTIFALIQKLSSPGVTTLSWPVFGTPGVLTPPGGEELLLLAPWKFIHYVMEIYRKDVNLLTQHPDAPLMGIPLFKT